MSQPQPASDESRHPHNTHPGSDGVGRGPVPAPDSSVKTRIAAVVLLAGVLPWVAAVVARAHFTGDYVYEFLHECMELAGTCIALAVATLLWLRSQYERKAPYLMWAAAALIAMGLIDGAHAVMPFGLAWSWLRHSATLVGGLLFALVWLPQPWLDLRRKKFFLIGVALLSLGLALLIGWKPGLFPAPWRAGDYTLAVKAANGLGGLGFLAAAAFFLRRYRGRRRTEELVLASHTMLFGVAGLLFGYSHVWHAGWWVWHGARLTAYSILLMTAYEVMESAEQEVRALNEGVQVERQRLHDVLHMLPAYVVLLSKDYHVPFANRYFEERFGKAEGRRCYEYLFQRTEPCENCETYKVLTNNAPHQWEWSGPNGRDYDIHDFPFTDSDGSPLILEMGVDITERKAAEAKLRYLNRSLRALSECNQLLLHASDEQSLLQGVCRILVEHCGHALAWVGYAEQDAAKTVRVVAAAGVTKDDLVPGLVTWGDDERGRGPTGTAIRTGKPVVLEDATTDPCFAPWREQALSEGFHSCVSLPVDIGESVSAGLTIYSTQRGAFQGEELQLLTELAQDLGYGVRMLRMRAEREQTQERMRYLALIVESSDDAIYSKDLQGTILSWNRGAEKVYGYTAQEIVGRPVTLLSAAECEDTPQIIDRIRRGETVEHYETVRLRKDGTRCDVSITVSPIRDAQGRITGASSIARDITEPKRAERRLAEQQFYTRSLIEASLDPLVTISRGGKITDVNRATEAVTGVAREQLIGTDFCDYFSEPEKARVGYQQVFAEGFVQDYPLAIRHTSGRLTDVLYNATVYRNRKGEVEGVFAAARDITERKRAEVRLREQAALLELAPAAILVRDLGSRIVYWSRGAEDLYGWSREEVLGQVTHEVLRAKYPRPVAEIEGSVLCGNGWEGELEHTTRAGRQITVSSRWAPQYDENRQAIGFLEINLDITERKRAEQDLQRYMQELERSNAELQDFASIASHDLQEPLRKVLAFGEHLREHLGSNLDELGSDFLARMQNAANRMSGLIEALLEYSRVTTRAQPFQTVDMTQAVFGVLADMEERIRQSHAQVEFLPMPKVMADPMQVRQLLQNLLGNALKFQPPGRTPQVELKGERTNGWCEFSVADNGIGFEEKYLDRIFRPFQRLHGRSEYEGSGMGLAICRKVVARHGGTISAHSRPGEGSTFVVTLPSAPDGTAELQN